MKSSRLLIVSNRLPVCAEITAAGLQVSASSGGLATGLGSWHRTSDALWIGWAGDLAGATPPQLEELKLQLAEQRLVPVTLSHDQVNRYYHGFANRVLWPTFHYLIDQLPVDDAGWDAYQEANAVFADAIEQVYRRTDAPMRIALEMRVMGGSQIYMAPQFGNRFGTCSIEVLTTLNTPDAEFEPTVTPDELTIFFASSRPGGFGGLDIWHSQRASAADLFPAPVNLTELNTGGDDIRRPSTMPLSPKVVMSVPVFGSIAAMPPSI